MADLSIKGTIDQKLYQKKVDKLLKEMDEPIKKNLPLFLEWFVQSAVKETPPKGKAKKKRSVITLRQEGRFSRRGKELKRYKVPFRTNKKKGAKYFDKKKDANAFAKITYRYVGKYGWIFAGEDALKIPLRVKRPAAKPEVFKLRRQLGTGKKKYRKSKPVIVITNKVERIGRYALIAAKNALLSTKRRINANKRRITREYKKLWQSHH